MKNRIKELMKSRGVKRDALAEMLDVHPVTISKLISGNIKLNTDWMERIAAALDIAPESLIVETADLRHVVIRAHVQAGEWAESNDWMDDDQYTVAVPDEAALRPYALYGAEARGPSMDKTYPEGTSLVFTKLIETREDIQPGKRYIVERERAGGMREVTVKTLWKDDDGQFWLLPESTDPRFQETIPLNGDEGDTIRIVGRVVYSVRRE